MPSPSGIRITRNACRTRAGTFRLCIRTAKCRCDKDTCCVIKRMRNRPHGQRSLLPQGSGWGACAATLRPIHVAQDASSHLWVRRNSTNDVKGMHTSSLHVVRLRCPLRVVKKTPLCRDSVMYRAVVSPDRAGRRVDVSTQERGGE